MRTGSVGDRGIDFLMKWWVGLPYTFGQQTGSRWGRVIGLLLQIVWGGPAIISICIPFFAFALLAVVEDAYYNDL